MKSDDIKNLMYGTRLLVFIETSPQSNKYNQIYFTPEEFKKMAFSIGKETGEKDKDGITDIIEFQQSVETYDLPDLKEIQ